VQAGRSASMMLTARCSLALCSCSWRSCRECSELAELLRLREEEGADSALLTSAASACLQPCVHILLRRTVGSSQGKHVPPNLLEAEWLAEPGVATKAPRVMLTGSGRFV